MVAGEEILRKGLGARGRVEWRGEHMTVLLPRGVHEFDWRRASAKLNKDRVSSSSRFRPSQPALCSSSSPTRTFYPQSSTNVRQLPPRISPQV